MSRSNAWYGCNPSLKTTRFQPLLTPLASFPDVIDCSQFREPVLNQGPAGTCTAHGLRGAMSHYIRKRGLSYPVELSRLWSYWWSRVAEGTQAYDSGAQIADVVAAAIDHGMASEENWAYDLNNLEVAPPDLSADASQYKVLNAHPVPVSAEGVKTALLAGDPVIIGITVFDSFEGPDTERDGIVRMPVAGESVVGGHCMKVDGFGLTMAGYFDVVNSWSVDWGRAGICLIPEAYFAEFGSDFWCVTMVGSDAEKQAGSA